MPDLSDFLDSITRSGLVPPETVDQVRTGLDLPATSEGSKKLARALIQKGSLTPYQARKILAGATRGFFLGGYRILRPLGEGGMGKVFLAAHEVDGQRVAIKVLPPRKVLEEKQALLRFRREMDLSLRANHPNLARTLDVGNEGDVYFMVMEYIPGESLYHAVKGEQGGPLRVTDTARFFLKVLDGLEAAHAAGLIHRDIKPSNIMITPDGDAKILDLGLARSLGEESPLTRPNVVIGTLDYASPEQLGNAAQADRRSDLYSVGCTLYFTLAGRPPFDGGDIVNKIFKQRMEDPEPLERVVKGVPPAFAAIVRKLMAKSPDDRYQTCAELRTDLGRWTDPEKIRSILGAEADSARAFHPPSPELMDDDLRLLNDEDRGNQPISLRDLGEAEPPAAPRHRAPAPPVPALVLLPGERKEAMAIPPRRSAEDSDSRWLMHFIAIAVLFGILAVIAISLIR